MRKTTTRNRILAFVLTFAMIFQQAGITTFADDATTTAATETTVEAVSETGSEGTAAISADETAEQTTAVTEETTAETSETTATEAAEAGEQTTAETDAQEETSITEASTENTADPAGETADTEEETEKVTEAGTEAAAEENTEAAAEDVTEAESGTEEAAESQTDAETDAEAESDTEEDTESASDEEAETETETETVISTEEESEAPKTEFEYEDERVIITAVATEEANLPQDAELKADYLEPDSDEYKEAVAAFNEQLSEELNATDDTVVVEYTLYDIYFVSASTDERIEPEEGKVTVTMTFIEPVAAEAEGEVISTEVVHLKNDGEAEIVTDYVDTNSDGEVTSVGFTQDSFSIDGTANVISLTAANNSVTCLNDYVTSVDYSNVTYSDDTFTSSFTVNFSGLLVNDIQAANYTYYYAMPSELDMPPIGYTQGSSLKGRLTDGTLAFTYSFVEINGTWYIEIVFDQDYIDGLTSTSTLTDGYIEFRTYIESSAVQQDGSLKIPFSEEVTINAGDITTSSNETWQTDISVSKSSSGYNVATGSITYTVTVSSVKGTDGDITLDDLVSLVSSSGLSFSSVVIDSVVLKETNNSVSYTENSTSDTLSITLGKLEANSSYVITYTVYLDASSTELDTYVKNTVTASADDDLKGEITTSQTQTTYVKTSLLSKSGSVSDSSTGEVTWTITVNPYGADVAGYVLEDAAFAGLSASDFTISGGAAGTDYEFVYASDSTITGIKFLGDSNTNTYTITYKTYEEITWGGSNTVTNEAGFSGGEASTSATGYPTNGSLSKSVEKASEDTTNDTITLSWTVTAEIPAGGIAAGTELLDCLGTYDKDFSGYTSLSNHWFTSGQMNDLLSQYSSSITLKLSDGNTKTISSSDYTLYAYDKTCGEWVAYSELSSHDSCKFTAFKVVFNSDIDLDCSGTWSITYTTTGDTSELVDSLTYYNSVQVGNLSTSASYKEEGKVVKTDGNGATGSSSINLDKTGTVTWIVKLYIPKGATTTYTVKDTLPKGITFDTAVVNASGATGTLTSAASMSTTMTNNASLTGTTTTDSDGNTKVTIEITPEVYANLVANGGYLTITYNCKLEDINSIVTSTSAGYTTVIGSYKNSVVVTAADGSEYGSADQTQILEYQNKEEVVDLTEVNKSYNWDNLNGELSYSVLLNPDAETLNNGDDMTFTDVLGAATWGNEGNFASLLQSSVKFYKLTKITDDNDEYNYIAADGTKYYKEEINVSWTYELTSGTTPDGTSGNTHTITATVPDSTAILVEYTYNFNIVGTIHSNLKINGLTNTATLSGTKPYTDENKVNSDYEESYFNAGISSEDVFTLVKVDSTNYNKTLSKAEYTLYMYDPDNTEADTDGWVSITTYQTDDSGTFAVTEEDLNDLSAFEYNTAYYLVETKAPSGYELDSATKYYFYWSKSDTTTYPESYPTNWSSLTAYNLSMTSWTIYAKDTDITTSVTVEKEWLNVDGTAMSSSEVSEIEVTLYQYYSTEKPTSGNTTSNTVNVILQDNSGNQIGNTLTTGAGQEVTINLTASNQWGVNYNIYIGGVWYKSGTSASETIPAGSVTGDIVIMSNDLSGISLGASATPAEPIKGSAEVYGTYTLSAANNWSLTLSDLPAYRTNDDGSYYVDGDGNYYYYYYYFEENPVEGYTTTYSNVDEGSFVGVADGTITITNQKQKGDLTVTKNFSGLTADQISALSSYLITVKNSSGGTVATLSLSGASSSGSGTSWTVQNLAVGTYTIVETGYDVNGYEVAVTSNNVEVTDGKVTGISVNTSGGSVELTNTYTQKEDKGSLTISKTVTSDDAGMSLARTFKFTVTTEDGAGNKTYYDETGATAADGYTIELTTDAAGTATLTINDLPLGTYTVTEVVADAEESGYTLTVTGDGVLTAELANDGDNEEASFTNSYSLKTINISGQKIWDDNSDAAEKRPTTITINLLANGTVIDSVDLTSADADSSNKNYWNYSFNDLPEYNGNGVKIVYTVSEEKVEDYTTTYEGNIVTNTYTPGKTSIKVTKSWNDNDNQDGKRPASVTVILIKNDEETDQTLELSESNQWQATFTDLDEYDGATKNVYTIKEVKVEGYESDITGDAANGFVITNTHETEKTEISVSKVWGDADDQDGIRPASVTVTLYANNETTGKTVTLNAASGWKASFTGLDKYANGKEIEYTVVETAVTGYEANYSGIVDGTITITNTHTPEITEITVNKVWDDGDNQDGTRASYEVTLTGTANGETVYTDTQELSATTTTYKWKDLPKYSAGTEITYIVTESKKPEGYTASYSVEGQTVTITNRYAPDETSVTIYKIWNDNNNQDGKRASYTVTLTGMVDGEIVYTDVQTLAADTLTYTWEPLDKYSNGKLITYTVKETKVPAGYTASYSDDGLTITNTYKPETVEISMTKVWNDSNNQDGKRASYTVTLTGKVGDETVYSDVKELSADTTSCTWSGLAKYSNGKEIVYKVEETVVPSGYTAKVEGSASEGFTITNTHVTETTEISGTKTWDDADDQDGARPDSITINLLANGTKVKSVTLTADNADAADGNIWNYSFTNLPKYANGAEITYRITEDAVKEYSTYYDGYNVTNEYTPGQTSVTVTKVWDDSENKDGIRPESVTVVLVKNGEDTDRKQVLSEANDWTATFDKLDEYTDGVENEYTVREETVDGYTGAVTGDAVEGFVITNSYETEMVDIEVTKSWDDADDQDGIRPESVKVTLYANDKSTGKTVTLSKENSWTDSFTDLDKYADGKEISYTVKETEVPDGYTVAVSGSASEGYTITNTHTPETTEITITKTWDDADNQDGKRPESITIRLLANTEEADSKVLTADDSWTWTFENLPVYKDGTKISYTITEDAVSNYSTVIDGYDVTNSYTPGQTSVTVTKAWNDVDDQDGIRPESVVVTLYKNGKATDQSVELSEENDWTYTFTNLDEYTDGELNAYTVQEEDADDLEGYTAKITGDAAKGFTITNTHETETIDIAGTKTWADSDSEKRPESITINLYADGKFAESVKVTAEDDWSWSFTGLAKYAGGKEIVYTITEDTVAGYITVVDGYDVTNTITSVKISKVDVTTEEELPGATIQIIDEEGNVVEEWTSTDQPHEVTGLTPGETYTLRETVAPDGYSVTTDTTFTLDENGDIDTTQTTTTVSEEGVLLVEDSKTSVKISKVDIADGEELPGATIQILDKDGKVVEEWTSTDQPHEVTGLKTGEEYTLRETVAPDGYSVTTDTTFVLKEDGTIDTDSTTTTVSEEGVLLVEDSKTSVKISKVDIADGEELPGATIQILDKDGKVVEEWTSTNEAHEVTGLKTGEVYTLRETVAPEGYSITTDTTFVLNADGTIDTDSTITTVSEDGVLLVEDEMVRSENASISVTKKLVYVPADGDSIEISAVDQTFYVALYYDEDCTQRASEILPLEFKNASSSTVTFTNIEVGRTYYIGECDEDGVAELASIYDGDGNICVASFDDGNVAVVEEEDGNATVYFANEFYTITGLGYSWDGELTITKKLLDVEGNAMESDSVFYAGIFTDPEFTTLATEADGVSQSVIEINLAGKSQASTTVKIRAAVGDVITFYVTETDENGVPVESGSDEFLYTVTVEQSNVVLSDSSLTAEVIITNQEVEEFEEEEESEEETETETETAKESETTTAVQTGDDTPLAQYFSLMLLAMAALLGEVFYRRKRACGRKNR